VRKKREGERGRERERKILMLPVENSYLRAFLISAALRDRKRKRKREKEREREGDREREEE
jgi:hypothetical protein